MIQIALTLWLLPALVIVLAVGGIGIVALAVSCMFIRPVSESLEPSSSSQSTENGLPIMVLKRLPPQKPEQQVIGPVADRATYRKRNCV